MLLNNQLEIELTEEEFAEKISSIKKEKNFNILSVDGFDDFYFNLIFLINLKNYFQNFANFLKTYKIISK